MIPGTTCPSWPASPALCATARRSRTGRCRQALTRLRRKLGRGDEADRRFVRVLAAVLIDGLDAVDDAVREALDAGAASDDLILNILARRREPPAPASITTSEALALRHPPIADCARYDLLRGSRAAA